MRERIANLRASIAELAVRRAEAKRADGFRHRARALSDPSKRLHSLAATARLMRQYGLPIQLNAPMLHKLRSECAALREQFAQDADSILKPDTTRQHTFWKPLAALSNQIEEELKQAWESWIRKTVPGGQEDLLQVLERFPEFAGAARDLRSANRQAQQLAQRLPASEADFEAIQDLAERMRQAWDRLVAADLSEEVKHFLLTASSEQATLADLTPSVLDWIRKHRLLRSFRVSIGGNRVGR